MTTPLLQQNPLLTKQKQAALLRAQQTTPEQYAQQQITDNRGQDPNAQMYWQQQDAKRSNAIAQITEPAPAPQAASIAQTVFTNRLNSINNTGQIQNQAVAGAIATNKARTDQIALQNWQAQQQQAYSDLQKQYTTALANGIVPNYAGTNTQQSGGTQQVGSSQIQLNAGQYQFANAQDNQIAAWARQAGWSEANIPMVVAISHAESGGNPNAENDSNSNGSVDRGLMQINSIHSDLLKTGDVFNPVDNLKMALQVYNDSGSWKPWSTYNNGAYQQYLQQPTMTQTKATVSGQPINIGTSVSSNSSVLRANLVGTAMKYLGTPYVFAGNSLTQGVDCSGLVQQVFKLFGLNTPRTADEDSHPERYAADGENISGTRTTVSNLKPGDLICWQGGWRGPDLVGHVAIYAGNGEIIESPDVGLTVRRRKLRANETDVSNGGRLIGIHLNLPGD